METRTLPAITLGVDADTIRKNAQILRNLLEEIDAERSGVIALMSANSSLCKHVGARTGYNERDGNWMAPCPTCGESR